MTNNSFNYEPVNNDLSVMIQWSQDEENDASLRVTSSNHFYLRPISQKTTDETFCLTAFFNAIIKWFMEGLSCWQTKTTAEKILQLSPLTFQDEIEHKLNALTADVSAKIDLITSDEARGDPVEHLKEFSESVTSQNEQIKQLMAAAHVIYSKLTEQRFAPKEGDTELDSQYRAVQLRQLRTAVLPLLARLELVNRTIKASIEQPLQSYHSLLSAGQLGFDKEELGKICTEILGTLKDCQDANTESLQIQLGPEEQKDYQNKLQQIAPAGFEKECKMIESLLENEAKHTMEAAAADVAQAKEHLQLLSEKNGKGIEFQYVVKLSKILNDLCAHANHMETLLSLPNNIRPIMIHERFGQETNQEELAKQLFDESRRSALQSVNLSLTYLKSAVINPLKAYLEDISQERYQIDKHLLNGLFSLLQEDLQNWQKLSATPDSLNPHMIELEGFIMIYAMQVAASSKNPLEKEQAIRQLQTPQFWHRMAQGNAPVKSEEFEAVYQRAHAKFSTLELFKMGPIDLASAYKEQFIDAGDDSDSFASLSDKEEDGYDCAPDFNETDFSVPQPDLFVQSPEEGALQNPKLPLIDH